MLENRLTRLRQAGVAGYLGPRSYQQMWVVTAQRLLAVTVLLLSCCLTVYGTPARAQDSLATRSGTTVFSGSIPTISIFNGSALPATVAPNQSVNLGISISSDTALSGTVVDFEVYDAGNSKVWQSYQTSVTFVVNTAQTFQVAWPVPSNQTSGVYTLKVGLFNSDWSTLYSWNNDAASFAVSGSGTGAATATATTGPGTGSTMTIIPTTTLGIVPTTSIGLNTAVWDSGLQDAVIPGMMQQAGVSLFRFPGGSTSDSYHWQTNALTPTGYLNPANTFDNFMANVVQPAHGQALITANYGSNISGTGGGDPNEAAAWVDYANNVKKYGVHYWEIGNEVYGNGYYGSAWETDLHTDHSPTAYATNAESYIAAMKSKDPTIKVGLVLVAPGTWPDGSGPEDWNSTVLSTACSASSIAAGTAPDFVSIHWYPQGPGSESDAGLLSASSAVPGMVTTVRSLLTTYCGARAAQMGIMVTESNSVSYNPGKQTTSVVNGLFLMQDYLSWLQAGAWNVTWWDLHNSPLTSNNNSSSLAGTTNYGDYGVLSVGPTAQSPELAPDAPFPTYTALTLLKQALVPGSQFIAVQSSTPTVQAWATTQANGQIALILVNTSPSTPYTVTPVISNGNSILSGNVTSFSLASPGPISMALTVQNGAVSYTAAPYSAAVIVLTTATGSATATPVPPTASPTASPTATASATSPSTASPTATSTPTGTPPPPAMLVVNPTSGYYHQTITITGTHFGAAEPVAIYFDQTTVAALITTTANSAGTFVARFTIPLTTSGKHTIVAIGQTTRATASATLTVKPIVHVSSTSGTAGSTDVLNGAGFGANETITGYWQRGNPVLGTTATDASGTFTGSRGLTFTVPISSSGSYTIAAIGQTSHSMAATTYVLTTK